MNDLHIKSGDTVQVISGDSKGSTGKVLAVSPKEKKVIVEGVNMVTKHVKPRQAGEQGGIIEAEAAMYATKVQVVCPACKKATRIGHKKVTNNAGKSRSVRICKKCGEEI